MEQTFNEITREVVDHFLQNIVFVDDNAYQTVEKANALLRYPDGRVITKLRDVDVAIEEILRKPLKKIYKTALLCSQNQMLSYWIGIWI